MGRHKKTQRVASDSEDDNHSQRSRSRERERAFEENQDQNDEREDIQGESGEHSHNQNSDSENNNDPEKVAIQIRSSFLDFFGNINNQKGFVFTPQQRVKLQKEQQRNMKKDRNHHFIDWKTQCEWDYDHQKDKIANFFASEEFKLPQQKIQLLKQLFLKSSYLFGSESTSEVYSLYMSILKICLRHPQETIESENEIRQFINQMRKESSNFIFFSFNFSSYHKLPEDGSVDIDNVYFKLGKQISGHLRKALEDK